MNRNTAKFCWLLVGAAAIALPASLSAAEGWGTLTGQIVYDGDAPQPAPIEPTKDPQFCGKFELKDEKLLVNPENGGVANVGVWLSVGRTDKVKPEIHESLKDLADQKVKVDNQGCRFEPHVSVVWTEQTVELANSDQVGHNTNLTTINRANAPTNQLIPQGKSFDYKFKAEENVPVKVSCNIHPWMQGYVIVRDTPYATVTDKDGKFTIENLPAGKWKFRFWQEDVGYLQDVKVGNEAKKWKKGEVEIEIKAGETVDLGVIKFAKKK